MTVLAVLLITLVATTAHASTACGVVYTISPQNSSDFGATITINNTGTTALSGWSLTWSFANGQTIASSWNGTVSQSGANVTVSEQAGQAWENIPAGGSYTGFGFNGTWNGATNAIPTNFAVNGVACGRSSTLTSTTTTLSSSSTSATTGAGVTLTAKVAPSAATGTVTFYDGSTSLGTGAVSSGTATLSTSFSTAGTHAVTAAYGGSTTYASSTSSAMSITVTASGSCSTTNPIVPYISVAGVWSAAGESSVSVSSGTAVDLGPQPLTGGSWSWTGPSGFTSTSREIDNIELGEGGNTYTATYTLNGCSYKQIFTIVVTAGSAVESVSIDLSVDEGVPTYGASGFIYGISEDVTTPAASYQSEINTRLMRAGGSQIGCPNGGWINGQFTPRWDFIQKYYARAKSVGSNYVLLMAGLWGADGPCTVPSYPGDNGNWTLYTEYLNQVIAAAQAAGMAGQSDFQWEIWNEPNGGYFWKGSETQFLEMWKLGYQTIRAAIPNAIIVGPSSAGGPGGTWWTTYLSYIKANDVIPNYLSWHDEPGDPVGDANTMRSLMSSAGISGPAFQVNEYGGEGNDQEPGPSAWYLGRFERAGVALAARGNWGGGTGSGGLYDTMADLLTPGADQSEGQWWVYERYAQETGQLSELTPSTHIDGTVALDSSAKKSVAVIGNENGGPTGNINVTYVNIPSWLVSNGATNVLVERMPKTDAYVSAPTVVSNSAITVSGNSITVTIDWTNALDAYAITLTP
jgi:hypothetical protein